MKKDATNPFESPATLGDAIPTPKVQILDQMPLVSVTLVFWAGIIGALIACCFATKAWPIEISGENLLFSFFVGVVIGTVNAIGLAVGKNTLQRRFSSFTYFAAALASVVLLSLLFYSWIRFSMSC